jgi:uncharacterized membrane protein
MMEHANKAQVLGASHEKESSNSMDTLVGYILLIGVLLSGLLIAAGSLWNWVIHHTLTTQFSIAGESYFSFLQSNLRQLFSGEVRPQLLISLGISTLMLTPYLRVAASVVYFAAAARNWKYTFFTLFVFSVLTYSLFLR